MYQARKLQPFCGALRYFEEIFMTEINASPSGNDAKRMTTRNTIALKAVITGMLIPSLFIAAPLELAFAGRLTKTIAHEEYKAAANESDIVVLSENSIPEAATQIILPNDAASENFDLNINIPTPANGNKSAVDTTQPLVYRYQQQNGEFVLINEKNIGSTDKPEPNLKPVKKAAAKKAKAADTAKPAEALVASNSAATTSSVPKAKSMSRLSGIEFDENGIPVKYKKVIEGKASAYTSYGNSRTATGTVPTVGTVAVNPKIIPYGTKMWITSLDGSIDYGFAVAEDTGGFVKWKNPRIVDLFMSTKTECRNWGVRGVRIYILE
jgi:3D (Asp-Asp-Asp) domain-containing protein